MHYQFLYVNHNPCHWLYSHGGVKWGISPKKKFPFVSQHHFSTQQTTFGRKERLYSTSLVILLSYGRRNGSSTGAIHPR